MGGVVLLVYTGGYSSLNDQTEKGKEIKISR
jgi:hypothetical protein